MKRNNNNNKYNNNNNNNNNKFNNNNKKKDIKKISPNDKKKAIELLNNGLKQKKKIDKIKYLLKSLDINPTFLEAFYNLGIIYFECAEKLIKDITTNNNNEMIDYIKKGLEYLYKVILLDTSNRGEITGFCHIALANGFIDYRNIIINSTELMKIINIDNKKTLYDKSLFHNNESKRILQNDQELDTYIFNYGELLVNLFDDYIDSIDLKLINDEGNIKYYNDIILQSTLLLTSVLNTYGAAIQTPYSSDIDTDILISKTEILIKYWDFQIDLYKYYNKNNCSDINYINQDHENVLMITRLLITSIINLSSNDDNEILNLASDINDSLIIWLTRKYNCCNSIEIDKNIKSIDDDNNNKKKSYELIQSTCEVLLQSRLASIVIFENNHNKLNKNEVLFSSSSSSSSKILDNYKNLVQSYANLGDSLRIISMSININEINTNVNDIIVSLDDVIIANNNNEITLNNDHIEKDNNILRLIKEINIIISKNIMNDKIIQIDNSDVQIDMNNQFILSLAENCYNKAINMIVNTELRKSFYNEYNEIIISKDMFIVNEEEDDNNNNDDDDDDDEEEDDTILQIIIDIVYNR
jgi:hypothetical protein